MVVLDSAWSSMLPMAAGIAIGSRDWLPWALALTVVAIVVSIAASGPSWRAMGRAGAPAAALRITGLVLLILCLVEPQWIDERPRDGENVVAVVIDNGRGLDVGGGAAALRTRLAESEDLPGSWLADLAETFEVRRFRFDDRLTPVESLADVAFDGTSSGLRGALTAVERRFRSRPLAAVVVLSDGNATDLADDESGPLVEGLPAIHAVAIGSEAEGVDRALASVAITQTQFEDAPVTVQVEVLARDERGGSGPAPGVPVRLVDADSGSLLAEETSGENGVARLRFRPPDSGVGFHRIEIDALEGELTEANNRRLVAIDRGGGPFRVLYVSGRPNWEFKFLNRALEEDADVSMVGLIRVARREPKFQWQGRAGESTNPLFRGFDPEDEAAAEYDQPVLIRMFTRDEFELAGGFPREAKTLFAYDAVVLDDVEAEFFTPDQLDLIRGFVADRGGGLFMLGGRESFESGGWRDTPVAAVLPVFLGMGVDEGDAAGAGRYRFDLTREGALEPWVRLRDSRAAEDERLAAMPEFWTLNQSGRGKPGAAVLATADDRIALATQRFGRGRAAVLAIGDLWRWGMRDPAQRDDLEKAWRQMIRWLVGDVPRRVEVAVRPSDVLPDVITARVEVRTPEFRPALDARVRVAATGPDGFEEAREGEPSSDEPGVFEVDFRVPDPGAYRIVAEVTGSGGEGDETPAMALRAETGWVFDPDAAEFARLGINRPVLERLAAESGGAFHESIADLDGLVDRIAASGVPVVEIRRLDLWHLPVIFWIGLGCLLVEWVLRRNRGFA